MINFDMMCFSPKERRTNGLRFSKLFENYLTFDLSLFSKQDLRLLQVISLEIISCYELKLAGAQSELDLIFTF